MVRAREKQGKPMDPELTEKLNKRKRFHTLSELKRALDKKFKAFWNKRIKEPESKPEMTEEQRKLRKIARRIHDMDYPPPPLTFDMWEQDRKKYNE